MAATIGAAATSESVHDELWQLMRTEGAPSSTGLRPPFATPPAWCYDSLPLRALALITFGVFAIVAIGGALNGVRNSSADSPSQLVRDTIGGPLRPLQAFGTSQTDLLEEKRMSPSQAGVSDGKFLSTSLLTKVDTFPACASDLTLQGWQF
mmetsp:Transcript_163626/g.524670  ORF Transcript_163626/g.524670 Transcript_163626/m.524670 type:complete len:151 (-) Transcript_163626:615-1067(-)